MYDSAYNNICSRLIIDMTESINENLKMEQKMTKAKDREIDDLRARLQNIEWQKSKSWSVYSINNVSIYIVIKSGDFEVRFTSPSAEQCRNLLSKIEKRHRQVYLTDSSSDVAQLLLLPVLLMEQITSLCIHLTPLTCDVVQSFSSQISDNDTIESLKINHNSIDDDGVRILAQSLKHNKKLQHLSLQFNTRITSVSVPSLVELICINSTLSVLDVSNTSIDTEGVKKLAGSLKSNPRLGKIVVDEKHKEVCTPLLLGKRLAFSYDSTPYEQSGTVKT